MKLAAVLYHVNLFLFTLIVLLLASTAFGEDTPPSKMPLAAQAIINREQDQEKTLQDKLALDIAKLHADLAKRLKPQEDFAIRNANLDGAEAIKQEISALTPKSDADEVSDPTALMHSIPRMSEQDWEDLPGSTITVMANTAHTVTGITVGSGEHYVIAPNPTDLWAMGPADKYTHCRWDGELRMMMTVGAHDPVDVSSPNGLLSQGEGALILSNNDGNYGDNWGFIRVKILKVSK
jgi:hypothetical protein